MPTALIGCASHRSEIEFELTPVSVGVVFSEGSEPTRFLTETDREWLAAAALFVHKRHSNLASTEDLNRFLAAELGKDVQLSTPFPMRGSREGTFVFSLRTGSMVTAEVGPEKLILSLSDKGLAESLIRGFRQYSGIPDAPEPPKTDEFGITQALLHILQGSRK